MFIAAPIHSQKCKKKGGNNNLFITQSLKGQYCSTVAREKFSIESVGDRLQVAKMCPIYFFNYIVFATYEYH